MRYVLCCTPSLLPETENFSFNTTRDALPPDAQDAALTPHSVLASDTFRIYVNVDLASYLLWRDLEL